MENIDILTWLVGWLLRFAIPILSLGRSDHCVLISKTGIPEWRLYATQNKMNNIYIVLHLLTWHGLTGMI